MNFVAGSVSNSQFEKFLRVRGMPVEDRRKPIHGGLTAAKRQVWRVLGQSGQKNAPAFSAFIASL